MGAADRVAGQKMLALPQPALVCDRLSFRTHEEMLVYLELKRVQQTLPRFETITIVPIPALRVRDHTWEVDFLVIHAGRAAVIEVDGGVHHGRWAADRSRDRLLEDGGVAYVERIPVEEARDPAELAASVARVLHRLERS